MNGIDCSIQRHDSHEARVLKRQCPWGHAFAEVTPGASTNKYTDFTNLVKYVIHTRQGGAVFSNLLSLGTKDLASVSNTLTHVRLTKYLHFAKQNTQKAMLLYVMNSRLAGTFMTDLHYVEVALRNKFDAELTNTFGNWLWNPTFLNLLSAKHKGVIDKAKRDAARNLPPHTTPLPGKVVAELTFGFWHMLTDRRYEHTLWVPCLHKAFPRRPAPRRSDFNRQLEELRHLRNRIAHHEPIFHTNLVENHTQIIEVLSLLCPETNSMMVKTSRVKRERVALQIFRTINRI